MENMISAYIPKVCYEQIEKIESKGEFFNNLITYFHRNKLPLSIVQNARIDAGRRIRFYLSKRNINFLEGIEFYDTASSYMRELMINYLFLPEQEKKKIKEGDV